MRAGPVPLRIAYCMNLEDLEDWGRSFRRKDEDLIGNALIGIQCHPKSYSLAIKAPQRET